MGLFAQRCPYCHSKNIQFMNQDRKGFSVGKAAAGAILTGGIGTLAGFAGKKGKTTGTVITVAEHLKRNKTKSPRSPRPKFEHGT